VSSFPITCALFAQNTRCYPVLHQFGTPVAVPRAPWPQPQVALPTVRVTTSLPFAIQSRLPSSQPYLRYPGHGDVPQCYKDYSADGQTVRALDGISLGEAPGEFAPSSPLRLRQITLLTLAGAMDSPLPAKLFSTASALIPATMRPHKTSSRKKSASFSNLFS